MRISILAGHLSGHGGTEKVITDLINNDVKNQYTLFLGDLNSDNAWMDKIERGTIKHAAQSSKILKLLFSVWYLLTMRNKIILVLNTKYIKLATICNTFRVHKYKIVSWIHFSLLDEPTVNMSDLRLADYHLAISTGIAKQMMDDGISSNRISIVYNPVFKQSLIQRKRVNQLSLCYVGRIQFKDQKNLFELFTALKRYNGDWKLKLIGDGDKKDIEKCKDFIVKNHLQSRIIWVGWVNDPWNYINDTDYVVLTSKYEGLPLVLVEAISRGVPCIASNCPTGTEDIINIKNGLLYNSGSADDLVSKLKKAKNLKEQNFFDPEEVKESLNKFSAEMYVKRMNDSFSTLLK